MTADTEYDDVWDSLWHGSALAAYLDQAREERGWPSSEATKQRANRYYEDALREKNAAKAAPASARDAGQGIMPPRTLPAP
jgi:hypothetical protein